MWTLGPVDPFWSEQNPPTGQAWAYYYDSYDDEAKDYIVKYKMLYFLHKVKVISFGVAYDSIDQIRIMV